MTEFEMMKAILTRVDPSREQWEYQHDKKGTVIYFLCNDEWYQTSLIFDEEGKLKQID